MIQADNVATDVARRLRQIGLDELEQLRYESFVVAVAEQLGVRRDALRLLVRAELDVREAARADRRRWRRFFGCAPAQVIAAIAKSRVPRRH